MCDGLARAVKGYLLEKLYRDAKIGKIHEGTSFLQLAAIAKLMLAKIERIAAAGASRASTFLEDYTEDKGNFGLE